MVRRTSGAVSISHVRGLRCLGEPDPTLSFGQGADEAHPHHVTSSARWVHGDGGCGEGQEPTAWGVWKVSRGLGCQFKAKVHPSLQDLKRDQGICSVC